MEELKARTRNVIRRLKRAYPDAKVFAEPLEPV
jgi:hypothetical protein